MRRLLTEVQAQAIPARKPYNQVTSSAQAAHARLRHGKSESSSNGRIDYVSALPEHGDSRMRCVGIGGCHHRAPAVNR